MRPRGIMCLVFVCLLILSCKAKRDQISEVDALGFGITSGDTRPIDSFANGSYRINCSCACTDANEKKHQVDHEGIYKYYDDRSRSRFGGVSNSYRYGDLGWECLEDAFKALGKKLSKAQIEKSSCMRSEKRTKPFLDNITHYSGVDCIFGNRTFRLSIFADESRMWNKGSSLNSDRDGVRWMFPQSLNRKDDE